MPRALAAAPDLMIFFKHSLFRQQYAPLPWSRPVYLHFPVGSSDDPYKVALRFSLTTGKTLPLGHFFLFHLSLRFGLYIDLESCKLGCKTGVLAFLAYCERKL